VRFRGCVSTLSCCALSSVAKGESLAARALFCCHALRVPPGSGKDTSSLDCPDIVCRRHTQTAVMTLSHAKVILGSIFSSKHRNAAYDRYREMEKKNQFVVKRQSLFRIRHSGRRQLRQTKAMLLPKGRGAERRSANNLRSAVLGSARSLTPPFKSCCFMVYA
jgi:hypothetical protein